MNHVRKFEIGFGATVCYGEGGGRVEEDYDDDKGGGRTRRNL